MEEVLKIIKEHGLDTARQENLDSLKQTGRFLGKGGSSIYTASLFTEGGVLYFTARDKGIKVFAGVSSRPFSSVFSGNASEVSGMHVQRIEPNWENTMALWELFPFTEPRSLRNERTTIGCGDRLGLATPGHIRAAAGFNAYPVLAQQSIRELTLTKRTYANVVTDTSFLVFQEGYRLGYGADGDHLKTLADIKTALDARMPMITLDLTEVMNPEAASWDTDRTNREFLKLPEGTRKTLESSYSGKSFETGSAVVRFSEQDVKRCALLYLRALDFSKEVDSFIRERRGDAYDLEISIDETTTPTLPAHHLFIASELERRGVTVNSLAPRFIGEFQKAVDYIGDIHEFERQFVIHCEIAKMFGNYKVSIHSGSDKFSVYPAIGKYTGKRLHLKTAGTSWLEALRTVAKADPGLYRRMHEKSFSYFGDATKLYHITADLTTIPPLSETADSALTTYLDAADSRQLLHITYGGLLNDPGLRADFFRTLDREEELHYGTVASHLKKHIELLGIEQR